MKVVVQRVSLADVVVSGEKVAEIGRGLVVLVGVERGDGEAEATALAAKISTLRIFGDEAGKMNLDVRQVGGEVLVVSQFTLAGSTERGRRPSFERAASPETARALVDRLGEELEALGIPVRRGVFAADMKVTLTNDGPVTFVLEALKPAPTAG